MDRIKLSCRTAFGLSGILVLALILALSWIADDAFARPKQLNALEVEDLSAHRIYLFLVPARWIRCSDLLVPSQWSVIAALLSTAAQAPFTADWV